MTLNHALQDFILESQELLRCVEKALSGIRLNPNPASLINVISKAVRTLKTAAVQCKQDKIATIAKAMESLLDQIRRGGTDIDDDKIRQLLSCCEIIKTLLKTPVALTQTA